MLHFRTLVRENTSCKQKVCRQVNENVCDKINNCGFMSWACNGFKWVCKTVTKTICDGPCKIWNYVVKPVVNNVYTIGNCGAQGMKEIAKNFRCLKYLPKCAASGLCYKGMTVPATLAGKLKCLSGLVSPSEDCLRKNKFV